MISKKKTKKKQINTSERLLIQVTVIRWIAKFIANLVFANPSSVSV